MLALPFESFKTKGSRRKMFAADIFMILCLFDSWRIILQRILVNILVIGLLAASGFTVVTLVNE